MQVSESLIDLVGNTPLVRLGRMAAGLAPQVLVKVEYFNPGGSVKDRIALAMVEAAERDGLIQPGGTIVEPTSGNTGVGLAIVANQRGYKCVFVMPDKMSAEKIAVLRAYGAEVVVCPTAVAPEHPDSYYSVSRRLAAETFAILVSLAPAIAALVGWIMLGQALDLPEILGMGLVILASAAAVQSAQRHSGRR